MKRFALSLGLVALAAVLAACSGASAAPAGPASAPPAGDGTVPTVIAKAIEVALIVTLAIDFARHDGSPIAVVRRELAAFSGLVGRRGTAAAGA